MKRFVSIALSLFIAISAFSPVAYADNAQTTVEEGAVVSSTETASLAGEGTQESPYLISSIEELVLFRDSVNAGEEKYNANGVYVALDADIDMADVDWNVNIGDDCNVTFDGIFDGKGHTLKNLTSTETAAKVDQYICTGLFGAIGGEAVVKNFTIENVTIDTNGFVGNNIAAVAGIAFACTGSVENVNVTGNISISAKDATGVGAIVGYDYYGQLTVKNCTVSANSGSEIKGAAYVGGVIGYASKNMTAEGNTVENITLNATSCAAGGVAGITLEGAKAVNNTVKNTAITVAHANWQNSGAVVVGTITKDVTVSGTKFENVTVNGTQTTTMVGCVHENKPTTPVKNVAAKAGDVYYTTFAQAFAVASDDKVLTLESDVVLTETLVVDKVLTIDLNGHTISQEKACTASYEMIRNNGTLTITDSSADASGKISFKDTGAGDPTFGWGSYTIYNNGTLVVEKGTIEHLGEQEFAKHMMCAIFQYTGSTTVNGGTISTPAYRSARLWKGDMTINGGEFIGQLWVQAVDNTSALTINGGKFSPRGNDGSSVFVENKTYPVAFEVTGGEFATKIGTSDAAALAGVVKGGTFTQSAKDNTNAALINSEVVFVADENGNYGLASKAQFKLPEAVDGVITLDRDYTLVETFVVNAGETVTIDLNGHTISMTDDKAVGKNYEMIHNYGDLTIIDSVGGGKLSYEYAGVNLGTTYAANTVTTEPGSVLTVKGGTIENLTYDAAIIAYAIDGRTNGGAGDVAVNIEGGKITSLRQSVRIFANSTTKTGTLNITGGELEGRVIVQNANASANKAVLNITGGTFNQNAYKTDVLAVGGSNGATIAIEAAVTGGTFNGEITGGYTGRFITGGTFVSDPSAYVEEGCDVVAADEMYAVARHNPTYVEKEEATCTETGTEAHLACEFCGKVYTVDGEETTAEKLVIAEAGHKEVVDAAKEPTYTATGLTEGKHCSVCKDVLVAQEVVPAKKLNTTKVTATNIESTGKIQLNWTAVEGAAKYEVWRAAAKDGEYTKIYTTAGTKLANTSVNAGETYYYKVMAISAVDPVSNGDFSAAVGRTVDLPRPTVTVSNVESTGKIQLTWEAVEGAAKYEVWRAATKDGEYTRIYTTAGTKLTNTSVNAGETYYYKVKAIHNVSAANGAFSAAVGRTVDLPRTTVTATNIASTGKIQLTWESVEGAAKYEVWRAATKDGKYTRIYTTTGTKLANTSVNAGETYYYKVRVIHSVSAATSAYSAAVGRTVDLPQPVISASLNSKGKPRLEWKEVSGATGYEIYRATSKDGTYKKIYTTTGTTFTNTSATAGTTYYYKVRAIHTTTAANSAYSTVKGVTSK